MEFRLVKSFRRIAKEWNELYSLTPEVSPFLDLSAFRIQRRYFYPYYLKYKCSPRYGIIEENNKIVAIIPF